MNQNIVKGFLRIDWETPRAWMNKELPFVWRGRETSGESHWNNDTNNGYITFHSPHECSGIFNCEFGKQWEFRGKKVSVRLPADTTSIEECSSEFKKFTEKRWNRECVSRWGRWAGDSDDDEEGSGGLSYSPVL